MNKKSSHRNQTTEEASQNNTTKFSSQNLFIHVTKSKMGNINNPKSNHKKHLANNGDKKHRISNRNTKRIIKHTTESPELDSYVDENIKQTFFLYLNFLRKFLII